MKLEDYGDESYKYPATYLSSETTDERYSYFPSMAGTKCSYRELSHKERRETINKAYKTCMGGDLQTRRKYCYGWN